MGFQYTKEQISTASSEELRRIVDDLASDLRKANMSAAHYKLQYQLATIERGEAAARMQVELEMAQREVEVLQEAEERRRMAGSPNPALDASVAAANAVLINDLGKRVEILQTENDQLHEALQEMKRRVEHRDGENGLLTEENARLKQRIRKNREHFNSLMATASENGHSPQWSSVFGTPQTPRNRANTVGGHAQRRNEQPFEALLLADKMLSQDTATATAPSTPTRSAGPKHRLGHTRGTHSLSSLPTTPNRHHQRAPLHAAIYSTPPAFNAINHHVQVPMSAPAVHNPYAHAPTPKRPRRDSSASTITASSVDEHEKNMVGSPFQASQQQTLNFSQNSQYSEPDKDDVPESQASLAASSMLRRTPHTSFEQKQQQQLEAARRALQVSSVSRGVGGEIQTKLFGHVRKVPGSSLSGKDDKKRVGSQSGVSGSPSKKGRIDGGVGLGIGGLVSK
jgi:hypothetical protein